MAIDFTAIHEAALGHIQALLEDWLPGGHLQGQEYRPINPTRSDRSPGSFQINVTTGAWIDFATEDAGRDLIALYAYLNGCSQSEAAEAVAEQIGFGSPESKIVDGGERTAHHSIKAENALPAAPHVLAKPIVPVPTSAPPILVPGKPWTQYIWKAKALSAQRYEPTALWTYRNAAGEQLGHVMRLESEGKKVTLPVCWCVKADGSQAWCLRAFPTPRPLYRLDVLAVQPNAVVIICEGEKAADAVTALLPSDDVIAITSPGGSKAAKHTDWSALAGREVIIWPDHDPAGERYARDVFALLKEVGAKRIAIAKVETLIRLLGSALGPIPKGFDAADLPKDCDRSIICEWLKAALEEQEAKDTAQTKAGSQTPAGVQAQATRDTNPHRIPMNVGGDHTTLDLHHRFVQAIEHANDPPAVFRRGDHLCRLIHGADGRVTVKPFDADAMSYEVAKRVDCYRLTDKGDPRYTSPPPDHMRRLLIHQGWQLPTLKGIVTAPSLRTDGSLLDTPGYDHVSRLFYQPMPGLTIHDLPPDPTPTQRRDALNLLWTAIGEFPYADQASRANALGLILSCALRPAIAGPVPMALLDATRQGTGKTLLAETATIIGCGTAAPLWPPAREEDEWRKRLMSGLIGGAPAIIFDNLITTLESASLASVLTATEYEDRLLGASKTMRVPVNTVFLATGNNIHTGADLARRCYRVKLDSQMERPWIGRSFSRVLPNWAIDHRSELLAAALILGRAWFTAGCPKPQTPILGRFESWSTVIGGVLAVAHVDGFLGNLDDIYDHGDDESSDWGTFLTAWAAYWGDRPARVGDLVQFMEQNWSMREALPPDLLAHYDRPASFMARLGSALRKHDGLVVQGYRLAGRRDSRTKNWTWTVSRTASDLDAARELMP